MRGHLVVVALVAVLVVACSRPAAPPGDRGFGGPAPPAAPTDMLRCEEVIDSIDAPPTPGGSYGYVTAVDAAALPEGPMHANRVPEGTPAREGRERAGYLFAKVGLVVRAGVTVDLLLPEGSPHRMEWGFSHGLPRAFASRHAAESAP